MFNNAIEKELLLITQMTDDIYIKTLKNTIQVRNVKYWSFSMIWLLLFSNKKLNSVATELFTEDRKLNISFVFNTQPYFAVPKNIRLNSTHYFTMKVPNMQERQEIAFNQWSVIDFKDFMNLYKICTIKPYSFLVTEITLASEILYISRIIFFKE